MPAKAVLEYILGELLCDLKDTGGFRDVDFKRPEGQYANFRPDFVFRENMKLTWARILLRFEFNWTPLGSQLEQGIKFTYGDRCSSE